ncbi:MAG: MATE family efflux transporter [Gemmataceae bacterium]
MSSTTTDDERPLARQLILLALPALAQQYIFFFIQNYDQFLARDFSSTHKAALTTANYLYWFVSSYSVIVSAGATAVVGRMVGAKDWGTANRAVGQSILLAFGFGLFGTIAGLIGIPSLLSAVQLDAESKQIAYEYLTPLACILAIQMIETAGIACLVGAGDTLTGLLILIIVATVNVPIAYSLSTGAWGMPNLGFTGIAFGTATSHCAGGSLILFLLLRGKSGLKVRTSDLWPDRSILRRILRVSLPAAFDSLSVAVCQFWFLGIVNLLGPAVASGHGIALRWEGLGYLSGAAFSSAGASLVARNLGAARPDRAARGGWYAFLIGGALMSLWGIVFASLARPMCQLFVGEDSDQHDQVVDAGIIALRTIACVMPWLAASIIFTGCLRAAGDTRIPVVFTWIGFLGIRIPLAYLLSHSFFHWGIFGIWLAMNVDIVVRGSLLFFRFFSGKWKDIRV